MLAKLAPLSLPDRARRIISVVARGTLLVFMVAMVAAYAVSAARSSPPPQDEPALPTDRMYS